MANKSKFQAIRGTRDLLPPDTALWNRVEQTAHEVFGTFGYGEIRPPVIEPTELFARAVGGDTDIVSKEMYTFPENPNLGEMEQVRSASGDAYVHFKERGNAELFLMMANHLLERFALRVKMRELSPFPELQSDCDSIAELLKII